MKRKRIILYFILAASWMAVIFIFSSQPADISNINNHFLISFLKKHNVNLEGIFGYELANFIVRKAGHITEYIILSILCFNLFYECQFRFPVIIGAIASILYSGSDEFHQLFVPGRSGSIRDVGIDSIGIFFGILIALIFKKLKQSKYWIKSNKAVIEKG